MNKKLLAIVSMSVACASYALWAVEPPQPAARAALKAPSGAVVDVPMTFRSSKLIGMKVKNPEGQDLGKIEDLVIDLGSGKVRYAALSFGGFLGVGDKLFAVPMHALKVQHEDEGAHFVLDINKERLEKAPGFSKDAWPDFADPAWGTEVDAFYGSADATAGTKSHKGIVVSTGKDTLKMTDAAGAHEHSHTIGPDVKITLDGNSADLDDLKKGYAVTVTMGERDGKQVVMVIEGHKK